MFKICKILRSITSNGVQLHAFFYKQHFYKQRLAEIGKKNQAKTKQHPSLNFCSLKIIRFLHHVIIQK